MREMNKGHEADNADGSPWSWFPNAFCSEAKMNIMKPIGRRSFFGGPKLQHIYLCAALRPPNL